MGEPIHGSLIARIRSRKKSDGLTDDRWVAPGNALRTCVKFPALCIADKGHKCLLRQASRFICYLTTTHCVTLRQWIRVAVREPEVRLLTASWSSLTALSLNLFIYYLKGSLRPMHGSSANATSIKDITYVIKCVGYSGWREDAIAIQPTSRIVSCMKGRKLLHSSFENGFQFLNFK